MGFRARRQQGFTLIECLVAVAIIGIVAAIAVPNLKRALTKARHRAAYNSIQVLEGTLQAYMLDNDGPPTTMNITTLEPLVSEGFIEPPQRTQILNALDRHRILSYYGWTGDWMWGYDYGITFRPKRDERTVTCYMWPEGAWRYDGTAGTWEQIW